MTLDDLAAAARAAWPDLVVTATRRATIVMDNPGGQEPSNPVYVSARRDGSITVYNADEGRATYRDLDDFRRRAGTIDNAAALATLAAAHNLIWPHIPIIERRPRAIVSGGGAIGGDKMVLGMTPRGVILMVTPDGACRFPSIADFLAEAMPPA